MGFIVQQERKYINQYGSLFHNLSYRETSTVFVLQQSIEPDIVSVPGLHGVDAKSDKSNLKGIELKSVNLPTTIRYKSNGEKYKGRYGNGHRLDHTGLVGKFDKMQSEERFKRVQEYDAFAFSIYANRHLPEVVFYIKSAKGVEIIQKLIYDKRQEMLKHTDTSSFKATIIEIKISEIYDLLSNEDINIIVDSIYVESTDDIKYIKISKEEYEQYIIGSEMPKGNIRRK